MHFKLKSNSIPEFCLVALLLLTHFFLAFTSFIQKSPTFDETVHETGGYCFWKLDDYRINPENGNFPQRWATIPLLFSRNINMPVFTKNPIIESNEWLTAYDFLFKRGNNPDRLFMLSRTMMQLSLKKVISITTATRAILEQTRVVTLSAVSNLPRQTYTT